MNRFQRILVLGQEIGGPRQTQILSAMINTIDASEACREFDTSFTGKNPYRRQLLKKITLDIGRRAESAHWGLIHSLEAGVTTLPGSKRMSAAHDLIQIVSSLQTREGNRVLSDLAMSGNASIRGQVYRLLKEKPNRRLPAFVLKSYLAFGDFEAMRILVNRASLGVLRRAFFDIEAGARASGALLGRLYLRLEGVAPATTKRLKSIDPITYVYVCVRLKENLRGPYLEQLYINEYDSDRAGLVVWCAGQMGHWISLKRMLSYATARESEERDRRRTAHHLISTSAAGDARASDVDRADEVFDSRLTPDEHD
jgi:hypothetical protein